MQCCYYWDRDLFQPSRAEVGYQVVNMNQVGTEIKDLLCGIVKIKSGSGDDRRLKWVKL